MPYGERLCNPKCGGECDKFCYFNTIEVKTNYDVVVSKTPEELAHWIRDYWVAAWCPENAPVDPETKDCLMHDGKCELCILDWLRQEASK